MKIKHFNTLAAVILAGSLLASCGKSDSGSVSADAAKDLGPVETMEFMAKGLADKQPQAIWVILPESYQNDINSLINDFAKSVDPDVYQQSADLVKKLVKVLKDKKDFILDSPMLGEMLPSENIGQGYEAVVGLLDTLVNSEFGDLEKMKTLDLGQMLATTGSKLMTQIEQAAIIMGEEDPFGEISSSTFELVSEDGDTATVRITQDGETNEEVLKRVEGKWVPAEMVDGFSEMIAEARGTMEEMDWTEGKMAALTVISGIDGTLDELLAANSAEEFTGAMMKLMGGLMGGGEMEFEEGDFEFEIEEQPSVPGIPTPGAPGLPLPPPPPAAPSFDLE